MNNKEKIIKCRVKSDSTFTDLIGYELNVVRDKAFYKMVEINFDTNYKNNIKSELDRLRMKYIGFYIGREQLDLNVYDHRKELAETFKGFKEDGAYSPIGKVDTSNPSKADLTESNLMKCRVNKAYMYYDTLKDLELYVIPNKESKGYYILKDIAVSSFKGDEYEWNELRRNYRVGKKDDNFFHIHEDYLVFQTEDSEQISPSKETGTGAARECESDNTRIYETGAKRASNRNKPFIHNLQPYTLLRFGYLTNMGAREYGDGNFLKGFPNENAIESLLRHITLFRYGDTSEDHLSSALFNIQLLILNQEKEGIKPDHWFKYEK